LSSFLLTIDVEDWFQVERFEKLDPFPILGFRMNFLKDVKRSAAAEQAFTGSGTSGEVLDGSGFVPEPPP